MRGDKKVIVVESPEGLYGKRWVRFTRFPEHPAGWFCGGGAAVDAGCCPKIWNGSRDVNVLISKISNACMQGGADGGAAADAGCYSS